MGQEVEGGTQSWRTRVQVPKWQCREADAPSELKELVLVDYETCTNLLSQLRDHTSARARLTREKHFDVQTIEVDCWCEVAREEQRQSRPTAFKKKILFILSRCYMYSTCTCSIKHLCHAILSCRLSILTAAHTSSPPNKDTTHMRENENAHRSDQLTTQAGCGERPSTGISVNTCLCNAHHVLV